MGYNECVSIVVLVKLEVIIIILVESIEAMGGQQDCTFDILLKCGIAFY